MAKTRQDVTYYYLNKIYVLRKSQRKQKGCIIIGCAVM